MAIADLGEVDAPHLATVSADEQGGRVIESMLSKKGPTPKTHLPIDRPVNQLLVNGSPALRLRKRTPQPNSGDEGAPLGVRLNSGTLTVNGEYESPASTEARTGVHAESHGFSRG